MTPQFLPNLVIAGVNKAATTSLFTYLAHHSAVCGSSIKETNYFMPVAFGEPLPPMETYASYFQACPTRPYRMEASPRYIFGGVKLAQSIRERLGPVRVVFVLRQPVDRMISYFKHVKRNREIPEGMSCDEYARRALEELPAALARTGACPIDVYQESVFVRGLAQGFYADYLDQWYSVFPDSIKVYFFEDVTDRPATVLRDACQWLEIDPSVYEHAEFTWENRSIAHRNHTIYKIGEFVNHTLEPFWRRHTRIKGLARDLYCMLNEKQVENRDLTPECRNELDTVYGPYNERLFRMLTTKGYTRLPHWVGR